ncbi:Predicted DNA-binding transcriptional regulator YafY, contains an HTH and WYL domains [Anaerocolumna jejuensis DSM 15929]|uniref:Predicted DNA-binding transcriptional regulator YafY, contains an HTH and WYL domains n=1 Tax=Anaerocolumna jejuensis DSM 15929 TaxID=1121322 RepID=A0A1M6R1L7_9FIRM|nr:YafY family protein [Anaerocolumna jejuensis]SHK26391.1 Predicted DNA-binding transcriptional regulator YafY, contains an HTH and WYL domains [Anaerocolumna jejuensis DSM 15929]
MKKLERMTAIIYLLHEKGKLTARDIAGHLEVSERTVYRDIDALSQIKVPVMACEGRQGGYEIDPGYFLPSIRLSEDEIINFMLLLKLGKEIKIPQLYGSYDMLRMKLLNAVTKDSRLKIKRFLDKFEVCINRINPEGYIGNILETLIQSLEEEKRIKIWYYTPLKNTVTERTVSPYRFIFDEGGWYVTGYCHLREGKRTFRLDRIQRIELLENTCSYPADWEADENTNRAAQHYQLQVDRCFYEVIKHNDYMENRQILKDGDLLLVDIYTESEDSILELALKNPTTVKIIEPESLYERIKEIVESLGQLYN